MNNGAHDMPLVSVLMNCFNGARFLAQAIDSVLAQQYSNLELVVWDNQSTDESRSIVEEYTDSRIRLLEAPVHTSLGEARRLALPYLKGEWVAILDTDDLWRPEKIAKQVGVAVSSPGCGFVYCATNVIWEPPPDSSDESTTDHVFSKFGTTLPRGNIYPALLKGNFISIASLLVNRDKLNSIGGFSGAYPIMEDYFITLNLARRYRTEVIPEVLCDYRVHDSNASLANPVDHFEDLHIVSRQLPEPIAAVAVVRILTRHLRKAVSTRQLPLLGAATRAIFNRTYHPDIRNHV